MTDSSHCPHTVFDAVPAAGFRKVDDNVPSMFLWMCEAPEWNEAMLLSEQMLLCFCGVTWKPCSCLCFSDSLRALPGGSPEEQVCLRFRHHQHADGVWQSRAKDEGVSSCGRCFTLLHVVIAVCFLFGPGPDGETRQSSVWRRLREPQESLPQTAAVSGDGETKPQFCLFVRSSWMHLMMSVSPVVSLQLELDQLDTLVVKKAQGWGWGWSPFVVIRTGTTWGIQTTPEFFWWGLKPEVFHLLTHSLILYQETMSLTGGDTCVLEQCLELQTNSLILGGDFTCWLHPQPWSPHLHSKMFVPTGINVSTCLPVLLTYQQTMD